MADPGSIPGLERSSGEGNDNPLQFSCLENPYGQRNLAGYSPWGRKESDMTEWLTLSLLHTLQLGARDFIHLYIYIYIYIYIFSIFYIGFKNISKIFKNIQNHFSRSPQLIERDLTEMELLNHMVASFLIFWGASMLFSLMTVPIYSPTNSAWQFPFLHICTSICYVFFLAWPLEDKMLPPLSVTPAAALCLTPSCRGPPVPGV